MDIIRIILPPHWLDCILFDWEESWPPLVQPRVDLPPVNMFISMQLYNCFICTINPLNMLYARYTYSQRIQFAYFIVCLASQSNISKKCTCITAFVFCRGRDSPAFFCFLFLVHHH